jgi:hypothetical protein
MVDGGTIASYVMWMFGGLLVLAAVILLNPRLRARLDSMGVWGGVGFVFVAMMGVICLVEMVRGPDVPDRLSYRLSYGLRSGLLGLIMAGIVAVAWWRHRPR